MTSKSQYHNQKNMKGIIYVILILRILALGLTIIGLLFATGLLSSKGASLQPNQSLSITQYIDVNTGSTDDTPLPIVIGICSKPSNNVPLSVQLKASNGTIISTQEVFKTPSRIDIKSDSGYYTMVITNVGAQPVTVNAVLTHATPNPNRATELGSGPYCEQP